MGGLKDIAEHNLQRRESSERMLAQYRAFNIDLVQVDVHSGPCPKCLRVQGKVFSISGNTPGFPLLTEDAIPPICAEGCRHVLLAAPLMFLEARGQAAYLRAFSCNDGLVVTDIYDYTDLRTGRSPGRGLAEGERIAEEYRASRQRRPRGAARR